MPFMGAEANGWVGWKADMACRAEGALAAAQQCGGTFHNIFRGKFIFAMWTDLISIMQQAKLVNAVTDTMIPAERDMLDAFQFAHRLPDPRPLYVEPFWKKAPPLLEGHVARDGGVIPRTRAASRLTRLPYALSVIATHDAMGLLCHA
jgi:hypothetical protein